MPVHAVWEITLACDLKCLHCGSRAGRRRPSELSTAECLEVVAALARLGTREVSLIGGEAYLRRDWVRIVRAIKQAGMRCLIQTGGRNLTEARLREAIDAGLDGVGVSVDGLRDLHDRLRGVPGSFDAALDTIRRAKAAGIGASANTQIGAETIEQLPELMERLIEAGATHWQVQLTVAMGNAVDHPEVLLQPHRVGEVVEVLGRLAREGRRRGFALVPGNNIGYFGPEESDLRGFIHEDDHWGGCSAGQTVLALEADGTVKGCPSLPTVGYTGGNVRELDLDTIWASAPEIHFGRLRSVEDLWGFCRTCAYNDVCRGGCTWTSHSLLGRPGNNPYCAHRVAELQKRGLRERIVKVADAAPDSFAFGGFALVTETIPGDGGAARVVERAEPLPPGPLVQLRRHEGASAPERGRVPPVLRRCGDCSTHAPPGAVACVHCGADLDRAAHDRAVRLEEAREAYLRLRVLLDPPPAPDRSGAPT